MSINNHHFSNWRPYLSEYGYNTLIKYVENVKNNIKNDTILLLTGEGPTGKSTLKRAIIDYIGRDNCTCQDIENINFHVPFKSLVEFDNSILIDGNTTRKKIQGIKNFTLFNLNGVYIHPDLHDFPRELSVLRYFSVIEMNHIFTR